MDSWGLDPNPKKPRIPAAETMLIAAYRAEWPELLMKAALDDTKRHNLRFVLMFPNISPYGGTVNYCKKTRRFDFIEYSSGGYAKRIDLLTLPETSRI